MSPRRVLAEHDSADLTGWMAYFAIQEKGRQTAAVQDDLTRAARGNRLDAKRKAKGNR